MVAAIVGEADFQSPPPQLAQLPVQAGAVVTRVQPKARGIRLAVMDMWRPFRTATATHAPQAAILFDKFHVMHHLGEALHQVRTSEYARLTGSDRRYITGRKYTLLSNRENLSLDGRRALEQLLAANKRLNTAHLLTESFGQLWGYPA